MSDEQNDARPVVGRTAIQPTEEELRMLALLREQNKIPLALEKGGEIVVDYHETAAVAEPVTQHVHAEPEPAVVVDPPVAVAIPEPVVVKEPQPVEPQPAAAVVMGDLDTPELVQEPEVPAPQVDQADEPMPTNRRHLKAIAYRLTPLLAPRSERSELLTETILLEIPGLSSFAVPPENAESELDALLEGAQFDTVKRRWVYVSAEQEATAEAISLAANNHSPKYSNGENAQTRALANPKACWDQQLTLNDGSQMPMVRSHGNQDNSALGRIRRAKGSGVPVTLVRCLHPATRYQLGSRYRADGNPVST